MKTEENILFKKGSGHIISPTEFTNLMVRNELTKAKIITQIEQLGIDIEKNDIEKLSLPDLYLKFE